MGYRKTVSYRDRDGEFRWHTPGRLSSKVHGQAE
jgi:hypothetical protein